MWILMFQFRSVQTSCSLEGLCDFPDLDAADAPKHLLAQQVADTRARQTWKTLYKTLSLQPNLELPIL